MSTNVAWTKHQRFRLEYGMVARSLRRDWPTLTFPKPDSIAKVESVRQPPRFVSKLMEQLRR
jgi:hypothetical protein